MLPGLSLVKQVYNLQRKRGNEGEGPGETHLLVELFLDPPLLHLLQKLALWRHGFNGPLQREGRRKEWLAGREETHLQPLGSQEKSEASLSEPLVLYVQLRQLVDVPNVQLLLLYLSVEVLGQPSVNGAAHQ